MFIPLDLNTPLVVGGLLNHWFMKSSKNEKLANARTNRGILIASGFIAGAALFGVIGAVILFITGSEDSLNLVNWDKIANGETISEIIAFFAFAVLICYFIWESFRAKEND
jgi:hypothetical protein